MNATSRLSRRAWLKTTIMAISGAAALPLLGRAAEAAPPKVSKAVAHYQDHPVGRKMCGTCRYFIPAGGVTGRGMMGGAMGPGMMRAGHCRVVQGQVSPRGYCLLYQPA